MTWLSKLFPVCCRVADSFGTLPANGSQKSATPKNPVSSHTAGTTVPNSNEDRRSHESRRGRSGTSRHQPIPRFQQGLADEFPGTASSRNASASTKGCGLARVLLA